MGKYVKEIQMDQPIDVVSMIMEDFMYHKQFVRTDWNGQMVYSNASGRYMNWYYAAGLFHIEAWKKGTFGGTASPDSAYMNEVNNLITKLANQIPDKVNGGHIGSDPLHHEASHGTNHTAWEKDTNWQNRHPENTPAPMPSEQKEDSFKLLQLGLLSLVFGIAIPFVGMIMAVITLNRCKKAKKPEAARAAQIGRIALFLSLIVLAFYVIGISIGIFAFMHNYAGYF